MKSKDVPYIAIIVSLSIHLIVLIWLNFSYFEVDNKDINEDFYAELEMDFVELVPEDPELYKLALQQRLDEEIRNLVANLEAERSNSDYSYNSNENTKFREDIEKKVKAYEDEFFKEARENSSQETYENKEDDYDSQVDGEEYDWYKNNKSADGPVSVSYLLSGRSPKNLRKPTYRCKTAGIVAVDIEVDYTGVVLSATINSSGTNTSNECLINESIKYAKISTFNSSVDAPKKQQGQIIYNFASQ